LFHFADSSANAWSSTAADFTLSIFNWSIGTDLLYFGFDNTALTQAQLNHLRFFSDAGSTLLGTGGWAGADGKVMVVVPEPNTAALLLSSISLAGLAGRRRRQTSCK